MIYFQSVFCVVAIFSICHSFSIPPSCWCYHQQVSSSPPPCWCYHQQALLSFHLLVLSPTSSALLSICWCYHQEVSFLPPLPLVGVITNKFSFPFFSVITNKMRQHPLQFPKTFFQYSDGFFNFLICNRKWRCNPKCFGPEQKAVGDQSVSYEKG